MPIFMFFSVFLLALLSHSRANYCVCNNGVSDALLQKNIDYACGNGADCGPINQNGVCFNPNNVKAHCDYAVNSYFQNKGQSSQSCNFAGTATLTSTQPASGTCSFPSTAGSSTTGGTTTPTTNPSNTTPTTTSPTSGGTGIGTGTGTGTGIGTGTGTGIGVNQQPPFGGVGVAPTGGINTTPDGSAAVAAESHWTSMAAIVLLALSFAFVPQMAF